MSQPDNVVAEDWGSIQIVIGDTDVSFFRDIPTQIVGWSNGEPFGDAQMTLSFPQITPFDELGTGDLSWLTPWVNIDVFHVLSDGTVDMDNPLFEGMVASFEDSLDEDGPTLTVECIGALYQLDLYVRAPKHIRDPGTRVEEWILFQWGKGSRMHLRTQEAFIDWPSWWGHVTDDPNYEDHVDGVKKVTGFLTADTGAWQKAMTGYIHEQLVMLQEADAEHGQIMWTIRQDAGRQPVMTIKDTTTPHWSISLGSPGVTHDLSHDYSQAPNTIYGEGTDSAGMKWRNSFAVGGYRPLAIATEVDPSLDNTYGETGWEPNPDLDESAVRFEIHQNYGIGVSLAQAQRSAQQQIDREADPGWYGTMVLRIDPEEGSRMEIRAGQNLRLRHFRGSGAEGTLFHIAECDIEFNDDEMVASLTVDTKACDLLTLAELIERRNQQNGQDAAKMLRAGRESGNTSDDRVPWDHMAGAGMIPTLSSAMQLEGRETTDAGFTPNDSPDFYILVDADNVSPIGRWGFAQVRVQEYGNISIMDLTAYDINGNVKAAPFHIGLYGSWLGGSLNVDYMPKDDDRQPNPFSEGVFDDPGSVDSSNIILWGQESQRAGYWPGLESDGDPITGKFRDDGGFNYRLPDGEQIIWIAIYCESDEDVYFQGRMWRGND